MKTMWRVLSGLCAAAVILAALLGLGLPVQAQSCTELLVDGGFETGAGWQLGPSPVMPQYVTYTSHSGNRALSLGITSGANVESFSSARQTVSIPAASPQVLLSFWFYAQADSPATTDYMEVVLLDASGTAVLNKPWRSHNDSRVWNQMTFDLTPWRGQTVQLYFNVYNDGVGGRAAMFLDDISLASCSGVAVTPTGTTTASVTPGPATATLMPIATPTPGCVDLLVDGGFNNGLANWQALGDPAGIAPVGAPARSAPFALKLGTLDQPLNSLNTARQLVTLPAGYPQVTLEAWVYTQAQGGAGADYQQIGLLDSSGNPLYLPWQRQENNPTWQLLTFNVSAFAGQTVFVSFSVNNDGAGGRTAMHVDDVRLRACAPGAVLSPTPTGTPTPSGTPGPTAPRTSTGVAPTYTTVPPGCTPLAYNGGFESGLLPWRPSPSLLPAGVVNDPVHTGAYAVRLGSQTENRNTYSSIRQTVTAPWGRPRVVVSFWAYTWAESLTGNDRQQFVVLGTDDAVWALPWTALEDTRAWQQYVFDINGAAGQAFDLYFNAINDGSGGRTALFIDEVEAWACTAGAYPPSLTGVPATATLAALPETTARTPAEASPLGPTGVATTVSLLITPPPVTGARVATETPASLARVFSSEGAAPTLAARILEQLSTWLARVPTVGIILGLGVLLLLFFLVLRTLWRR